MYVDRGHMAYPLPGLHQVEVAPQRVDLPIVSDVSHRVGSLPGGERVGGEPESEQVRCGSG